MNNKQENDKISALIEDLLDEVLDLDADDLGLLDVLSSDYVPSSLLLGAIF